jgi:hypothetical protein
MPPPNKRPPPPVDEEPLDKSDKTDPGAPLDLLTTGQMRIKPRKPAPAPARQPAPAPPPAQQPVAAEEEEPPVGPGERTLIYDQNKGRAVGTGAKLLITAGPRAGSEVPLTVDETSLGRGSDNVIVLPDISVSRHHSVVRKESRGYVVLDLGSGNGTRVNGLTVGRHELQSGDVIDLGDSSLQFVEAGGVAVKTGKRSLVGSSSGGQAAIRAGGALAAQSAEEDRGELTNPRGTGLQRRTPLYGAVCLALALAIGAGYLRKKAHERADTEAAQSTGSRAAAQKHFTEAVELVKAGKWIEARDKLAVARSLDEQDEEVRRYLERAKVEAPRAQAVAAAQQALSRRDYKTAREQLGNVPDDSALADKAAELTSAVRQQMELAVRDAMAKAESGDVATAEALISSVLEAEPDRREAIAVRDLLESKKRSASAARRTRQAAAREEEADARAQPEPQPQADAAMAQLIDTYLSGDVRSAITRAESAGITDARAARMARELRELDAAWREGLAKADAKKPTEALRALEGADKLDRGIAGGKPSKIGKELRKVLSRIHYQLGVASVQSDDGLPRAAGHLRSAVLADPENDLAKQQLDQVVARAKELYLRAYVVKDTDSPAAREGFKLVVDILPAGDATSEKAKRWLEKIDGKPGREEAGD